MKVPIVYIAGPYLGSIKPEDHNASSFLEIDKNINHARDVAVLLAQHGIGFFCPHMNSAHFEVLAPDASVDYWYAMDLSILHNCEAILMLSGWESSHGAKLELEFAKAHEIPDFYETCLENLFDWHADNVGGSE